MNDFPDKRKYVETHVNPELFPSFDGTKIHANKLHSKILNIGKTLEEQMYLLSKYIGAYRGVKYEGTLKTVPGILMVKVTPKLHNRPLNYGWYTAGVRIALEGAVQYYKPKNVLDIGLIYGKSGVGILQSTKRKINYIGVGPFQPGITNIRHITKSPLDKLLQGYPRLETTVSNLAPYSKEHNIHVMAASTDEMIDVLEAHKFVPDLLSIDSIRDADELYALIYEFITYNPDIVIVGDDRKDPVVQRVVNEYKRSNLNVKEFSEHGYIITRREIPDTLPPPVSYFDHYPKITFTEDEQKQIPENLRFYIPDQQL